MILADALPIWLQYTTDFAQILAAVGVIVAFAQLRTSSKQFHKQLKISTDQFQTQLKVTQDQFRVLNQGFLKMVIKLYWIQEGEDLAADPTKAIPLDLGTLYYGGKAVVNLENVGNLPVKYDVNQLRVVVNDQEVCNVSVDQLTILRDTIQPKTDNDCATIQYPFTVPMAGLHLSDIAELTTIFTVKISYHDYYDIQNIKTIDRELQVLNGMIYNIHINDKLE